MKNPPSRITAILIALAVNVFWATSWVFIKIGLEDIPGLTFAGLRYTLAVIFLFPFLLRKSVTAEVKTLDKRTWIKLIILGIVLFSLAQGGQFLALSYLPSVSVGLILSMSSLFVAMVSYYAIREKPTWLQWLGVLLNFGGILLYFSTFEGFEGNLFGWIFAFLSLVANGVGTILGRNLNKGGRISPIVTTTVSMGVGAVLMLIIGVLWQGFPPLSLKSVGIIVLLASVNTALAFTLWNYSQQTLGATEASVINNTMLVHIAILAWIFLGEKQSINGIIGLALVTLGAVIVQIKINKSGRALKLD
jgi:drug/metabolite transporter (DMT)-like permease